MSWSEAAVLMTLFVCITVCISVFIWMVLK